MMQKIKKMFGAQDMTVGRPMSNILAFSVPLLIGNLAQQLYNTVDSIVVGQYVGDAALAAVGASGPILNLLLLLFMGISTGAGILVSQYFGAKKKAELTGTVGTCLALTFIAGIVMMAVGPLLSGPLMRLLDTPPDVYDMAVSYLRIIFLGMLGSGFYNIVSGVLRGMGDSVTPLLFLMLACLLNIVLDLLFVVVFAMGVAGVAWATIIAQAVSAVFCLWRLTHIKDTLVLTRKSLIPDKMMTRQIVRLGLPSGLTQAIFSMAAIVVQALTNSFGTTVMACSIVVMRVDGFAMMPNFTFGMAMTTFVGQNVGARKMDRVKAGVKDGVKLALIVSTCLTLCILFFGKYLMRMFTNTEELVDLGVHMMRILAVGYIAMSVTQCLSGVMRGAGDTMTPMWVSILTTVAIRVPIAYTWAFLSRSEQMPQGNPDAIFGSLLISWVLGAVITALCYKRGKWRERAENAAQSSAVG
ncbi:MAG: MATE family efflux transporter [Clostridiales bacterium]|nr:MATE family efflux transporter [Clostridiales bacterium]